MSRLASTWRDNLVCLLFSYMYLTELGFLASPRRRISFSFSSDSAFTPRRNLLHRHSLIIVFRLRRNYQLSVKSPQLRESTQDRGGPWPVLAHT